ncbi:MAG: cation:proton antiporter [Devosia nanyangense]|uniref:Cation:proton antiporter n=1 Tax=Devosia nanyangense TaxID=1228055 RepID=A0A933L678_9HYPH|nr:cation:proton antiporter [Devosia nanyangense]
MIELSTTIAMVLLGLAMAMTIIRIIVGPSLADRILGLDLLSTVSVAFIAVFAIRTGLYQNIDIAVALTLLAFLSTAAFARYLLPRWHRQ